jgi:cytochrome c biogenesis factor
VWLGALLMALGGVVAIFDRRYKSLRVRERKTPTKNATNAATSATTEAATKAAAAQAQV